MPETLGINRYNNVEEEKLSSQEKSGKTIRVLTTALRFSAGR